MYTRNRFHLNFFEISFFLRLYHQIGSNDGDFLKNISSFPVFICYSHLNDFPLYVHVTKASNNKNMECDQKGRKKNRRKKEEGAAAELRTFSSLQFPPRHEKRKKERKNISSFFPFLSFLSFFVRSFVRSSCHSTMKGKFLVFASSKEKGRRRKKRLCEKRREKVIKTCCEIVAAIFLPCLSSKKRCF